MSVYPHNPTRAWDIIHIVYPGVHYAKGVVESPEGATLLGGGQAEGGSHQLKEVLIDEIMFSHRWISVPPGRVGDNGEGTDEKGEEEECDQNGLHLGRSACAARRLAVHGEAELQQQGNKTKQKKSQKACVKRKARAVSLHLAS